MKGMGGMKGQYGKKSKGKNSNYKPMKSGGKKPCKNPIG